MRRIDLREGLLTAGFVIVVAFAAGASTSAGRYAALKVRGRVDARCTFKLAQLSAAREADRNALVASSRAEPSTAVLDDGAYRWTTEAGPVWTPLTDGTNNSTPALFFVGPPITRWTPIEGTDEPVIRRGDIVLDAGAHSGGSARHMLDLGARLVISVEPDASNLLVFRRNLASDIAAGRIIVIAKGVYDREGVLTFVKRENSWSGEFHEAGDGHEGHGDALPVTTIDAIVAQLQLTRLDFIKMDIEGSEPAALRGARETLRRFKPRIAVGTYHRPGDLEAVERIVRETVPSYQSYPSRCLVFSGHLFPNLLYFR
jgi:FkbM family methyltransferase